MTGKENMSALSAQEILSRCRKQARIGTKYRLPTFSCPNCNAKNIMFAGDISAKNETEMKAFQEGDTVDYVIICPKCKKHIGIRRYVGMEQQPLSYRTVRGTAVCFAEVYNYRFLTEKSEEYIAKLPAFEGVINNSDIKLIPRTYMLLRQ